MRVTGPTARRRNHARLQMRSRARRAEQLARRQQQQGDTSDDDLSDNDSVDSLDSLGSLDTLNTSDNGNSASLGQTLRQSLGATKVQPSLAASASTRVQAGRLARRQLQQGDTSDDSLSDNDSVDSLNSSDDGNNTQPTPTSGPSLLSAKVRPSLSASVSARVVAGRLAQRQQQQEDTSDDGTVSDNDSIDSLDSLDTSDDGNNAQPIPTSGPSLLGVKVRPSLSASVRRRVEAGRLARRQQDDTSDDGDLSDNDSVNSLDSLDSLNSLNSSNNGNNNGPTPTVLPTLSAARVRPSLAVSGSARARIGRLARRQQQQDDTSDDGVTSDNNSVDSVDSLNSTNNENNNGPTPTTHPALGLARVRPSLAASVSARVRTERWIRDLHIPRQEVTAGEGDEVDAEDEADEADEADENEPESGPESVASDGLESDGDEALSEDSGEDEPSTAPPAATTPPPADGVMSTIQPPPSVSSITSQPGAVPIVVAPASSSSSFDELVSSLTGTAQTTLATSTNLATPSLPATGAAESQDPGTIPPDSQADQRGEEGVNIGNEPSNKLEGSAIAGIVLGVLTFAGLLVGAALLWRRRRRERGLPFFPQTRLRLRDDDDGSHPPSVTGPLPGTVGGHNAAKTNTQIMDDLMKAAYASNNGGNDMEGAYAPPPVPKLPPQQQYQEEVNVFMDEKAYAALAGPPTPATAQKPVMRWLDGVKTPTQPNGPEIPPTPAMPHNSATMPSGGARGLQPPRPAYYGRDTMTTETTNTDVRWYG